MAIVINPDGTVSTIEVDHDAYGNIRPKMPEDIAEKPSEKQYIPSSQKKDFIYPRMQKKKHKKVVSSASHEPQGNTVKSTKVVTKQSIDRYFAYIKSHHQRITDNEYTKTLSLLQGEVLDYYKQRYMEYKTEHSPKPASTISTKPADGKKKKKKNKQNKQLKKETQAKQFISRSSGFTIAEIASFSCLKGALPGNDIINGRSIYGASRNPKYGYARDRYGRVQERDSYNEERRNEFHNAQNHQRNYDYSSYDANDDHDGAYSDWE